VELEREDARATLALQGKLDLETAPQFGELVGANQRAHRGGRRLIVVKGHDTPIDSVLHMAAVDETIETTTESP
jgi:hypothetical protein